MRVKAKSVSTQIATIVARELDSSQVTKREVPLPDGGMLKIRPGEEPGVKVVAEIVTTKEDQRNTMMVFNAMADRPDLYPSDLPFVAEHSSIFTTGKFGRTLCWETKLASAILENVISQSEAAGWTLVARRGGILMFPTIVEMKNGPRTRGISSSSNGVFVIEGPETESETKVL